MKPTTYTELVTAVQDYLKRGDITSGDVDYLITEAEEEMNARLRVRRMLTALTPTVSSTGAVTIPTDFGGWKRFTARDSTQAWDLDLLDVEQQYDLESQYAGAGRPVALVQDGTSAQIWPYTDGLYTFRALYYGRIPNLTSVANTNWLLTRHPMAYLYGCLAAARGFLKDEPRAARWLDMFNRALDRVVEESDLERDSRDSAALSPNTTIFGTGTPFNVRSGP